VLKNWKKQEYQNNEDIKDDLSAAAKDAAKLAAQIKEMKEKILSKKTLSWEDKKQLEDIQKKHDELAKELQEIKDKYEENLKNQDEFKKPDEEILKKQEKLQEMMNDMLSDEMKDLMKQIEDILKKMEQKNTFENLDKMELSNKDLKSELDKMENCSNNCSSNKKRRKLLIS
jgi:chromosome segregation ATPase